MLHFFLWYIKHVTGMLWGLKIVPAGFLYPTLLLPADFKFLSDTKHPENKRNNRFEKPGYIVSSALVSYEVEV